MPQLATEARIILPLIVQSEGQVTGFTSIRCGHFTPIALGRGAIEKEYQWLPVIPALSLTRSAEAPKGKSVDRESGWP
jgi:hypothetical protein